MGDAKKRSVKIHETKPPATRCAVLHLDMRLGGAEGSDAALNAFAFRRDPQVRLEEAIALTQAIDLHVVASDIISIRKIRSATVIGQGLIESWRIKSHDEKIEVIIVDTRLTAVQQRNLEKGLQVKVLDRTALILEIFGARAKTNEGRLQVDLARLSYQRSRLVRSWTHLERQRGGAGFMGGPGESQLEIDRRLINDRISRLKSDLLKVRQTRKLQRERRKATPIPVVAIVGYTNAGKSTLFNSLTQSSVLVKDMLFATLDPTLRKFALPSGQKVVFADTVGFVSDLPHELVDAFRATLEEVQQADLILHVRNLNHPDWEAQYEDVNQVLESLGVSNAEGAIEQIEIWNKADLPCAVDRKSTMPRWLCQKEVYLTSAVTGEGLSSLLSAIDRFLTRGHHQSDLIVPWSQGDALAWLYEKGDVKLVKTTDVGTQVSVRLTPVDLARFEDRFGAIVQFLISGDVGDKVS